ncbi:MAG: helix-turn-helix transcriptional regulator [bacterium]
MLETVFPEGSKELTSLGKRLEILRIERGISKQRLARHADTSRQQLWRVMTGKSELTRSLRDRLAGALSIDPGFLSSAEGIPSSHTYALAASAQPNAAIGSVGEAPTIALYLTQPAHLVTTLRTLPSGDAGRRLKRALLNALEDLSVENDLALPADFSEIRRGVLSGEL